MKKIIWIVIICVLGGVAAAVFFNTQKPQVAIEEVLPGEVIGFVKMNNIQKAVEGLIASPFWKSIQNINYDQLMQANQTGQSPKDLLAMVDKKMSDPATKKVLEKFLGRESAIAIYPIDFDVQDWVHLTQASLPIIIEDVFSQVVLVTRVSSDVQLAEFVSGIFQPFGKDLATQTFDYKGHTIHSVVLPDVNIPIGIVRIKDLLIMSVGDKAARASVDVVTNIKPSLAKDESFQKADKAALDPADIFMYWHLNKFFAMIEAEAGDIASFAAQNTPDVQKRIESFFTTLGGFESSSLSGQWGNPVQWQSLLFFDENELDPQFASSFLSCTSVKNNTLSFTPKNVLGYGWGGCLNLDNTWEQIKTEMVNRQGDQSTSIMEAQVQNFEKNIGFSIKDDVLPAFGEEFGGYLSDIETGGMFPIPKFALFIQVEDQNKAGKILDKLTNQPFITLQKEEHAGITVHYAVSPLGEVLQPSYCFLGDYLLIAINRALIKKSIEAYHDKSLSLLEDAGFKAINMGLTDKNVGAQFININKVSEKLGSIIEWSNGWVSEKSKSQQAFKAGQEKRLEDVVNDVTRKEKDLSGMKQRLTTLEDQIWDADVKGQDVSSLKEELNQTKNQMEKLKNDLIASKEQKVELENLVGGSQNQTIDPALRRLYLDEVVYPILDGLTSFSTLGSRTTRGDGEIKTLLFLDVSQ